MARAKGGITVKKKVWIPLLAPKLFNEQEIGHMYLENPEQGVGRKANVSLMIVTGEPQKQNLHVTFAIKGVSEGRLTTELIGYNILASAAKKLLRRGREKIELSFLVKTKDNKTLRIRPLIVTRGKPGGGVLTNVRNLGKAHIIKAVASANFLDLMRDIVQHKFQRNIQDKLRKTYPVQICEIKSVFIVKEEAAPQPEKPAEAAKV